MGHKRFILRNLYLYISVLYPHLFTIFGYFGHLYDTFCLDLARIQSSGLRARHMMKLHSLHGRIAGLLVWYFFMYPPSRGIEPSSTRGQTWRRGSSVSDSVVSLRIQCSVSPFLPQLACGLKTMCKSVNIAPLQCLRH